MFSEFLTAEKVREPQSGMRKVCRHAVHRQWCYDSGELKLWSFPNVILNSVVDEFLPIDKFHSVNEIFYYSSVSRSY